jgi:cobalt-zinc-cadmium efflux system membrane fusion protein
MKRKSTQTLFCMVAFVVLYCSGCKNGGGRDGTSDIPVESAPDEIVVTAEQFESSGMRTGDPEQVLFRQKVMANGYITAAPDGMAEISTMVPARVKNVKLTVGDFVKEDQILFTIEGDEIIALQQEYLVTVQELKAAESEYFRQVKLAEENITSKKDFIKTESNYLKLQGTAEGLRLRLSMINLNPEDVEAGRIYPATIITSPIEGYVIDLDIMLGQFIQPGRVVMKIIDPRRFELELNIFEQDLVSLVPGQKVIFHDPDDREKVYEARLARIGKAIDPETRTVNCIASLAQKDRVLFVNGLYVQAEIITSERFAPAITQEALIRKEDRYYVLSGTRNGNGDYLFHRVPVSVGIFTGDRVEVRDSALHNVLLEGAYNLTGME